MQWMTWKQIRSRLDCRGRWVALQECRYDERTGEAREGILIDLDEELSELCSRVREGRLRDCAILFCSDDPGLLPD